MTELVVLFVALLCPVFVAGAMAWYQPAFTGRLGASEVSRRLHRVHDVLVRELGPIASAIALLLAGWAAIVVVMWPLGELAQALQPSIDVPVFEWMQARISPDDVWSRINATVTNIGDPPEMRITILVAGIVLAILWWRKGWWIPPLVLFVTYQSEAFLQRLLSVVVDRDPPPTGVGTFPSGGSARVLAVYGIIFFLVILMWPSISRRWQVVGWTTVGALAVTEGYTRIYLGHHYLTDVPAGWTFGLLLLLVIMAGTSVLVRPRASASVAALERSHIEPASGCDPPPSMVDSVTERDRDGLT